jgi:hypothetical protein
MIGYPALQNSIDDSHMQNMERGFTILGNNIDHVVSQDAPKQNVELNLKGGTLKAVEKSTVYIKYLDPSGTTIAGWNYDAVSDGPSSLNNVMTLTYAYHGDKQIGYEFGGVWENIGTNGYVLKDPKIVVGDPFIIPIVNAYSSGRSSIGGESVAKVIIDQGSTTITSHSNVETIEIIVTSDYYKGWESYFKSINMNTFPDDANKKVTGVYTSSTPIEVKEVNKPLYLDIIL